MTSSVPVFVINLDRSPERLEMVRKSARSLGIDLTRIPAVEGSSLSACDLGQVDEAAFERDHGKRILPGEIGCYLSHLKALRTVVDLSLDHAVIVEDDAAFLPGFESVMNGLVALSGWDAVKLVNNRTPAFVPHARLDENLRIGRCAHGPCGSSAAYAVTRRGAQKMLRALGRMRLPYDVALERGWDGGWEVFTTEAPAVGIARGTGSTISSKRLRYRHVTFPAYRRLNTLRFRSIDYVRRILYALARTRLTPMGQ